jgi:hypothetical protein
MAAYCIAAPLHAQVRNVANEKLLAQPERARAALLGAAVQENCKGTRTFYQGIGDSGLSNGHAFWSVACTNGASYQVMIKPDAKGSTSVMNCELVERVNAGRCWTRLKAGPLRKKSKPA